MDGNWVELVIRMVGMGLMMVGMGLEVELQSLLCLNRWFIYNSIKIEFLYVV